MLQICGNVKSAIIDNSNMSKHLDTRPKQTQKQWLWVVPINSHKTVSLGSAQFTRPYLLYLSWSRRSLSSSYILKHSRRFYQILYKDSWRLFPQYLCTGFGNTYNYVLERSSQYAVGVPQSSTKGGELYVYKLLFFLHIRFILFWV